MFYGVAIYHAMFMGDAALAQDYLERMTSVLNQGTCYATIYHAGQSSLVSMLRGEFDKAIELAERCMQLTDEAGVPLILNGHQWQLANILLEAQQYGAIARHVAEIRLRAASTKSAHLEAICLTAEAVIALQNDNPDDFRDRFSRAVSVCKKTGLRLMTFLPGTLARICATALEVGIEVDYVRNLVRKRNLLPPDATYDSNPQAAIVNLKLESWPWPIKIYTLGRFELLRDDKPMIFSGKAQQKPLSLLKALIAFGGRNVSEDRSTDALWPDAEGDSAHTAFDTTLHRLRKLVGNDKTLVLRDGMLSLDERHCWTDVGAFERMLEGPFMSADLRLPNESRDRRNEKSKIADRKSSIHDPQSEMQRFEKALRLYRGHFLPADTAQPWTIFLRERLRTRFIALILKVGRYWEERKDWRKAKENYQRGIETDGLCEEFYQQLMQCLINQGQEAAKVYSRCRAALHSGMALEPSTRTEEIYASIKRKGRS